MPAGGAGPRPADQAVPQYFRCPISLEIMRDPVIVSTGHTYDRSSIHKWISSGNTTCPLTMQRLLDFNLIPNHTLRRLIQEWSVANRAACNRAAGDHRPIPQRPVDPSRVSALLADVASRAESGYRGGSSAELMAQVFALGALRGWVREEDSREHNRTALLERGAVPILVAVLFGCCDLAVSDDRINGSLTERQPDVVAVISVDNLVEQTLAILVALLPGLSDRERRAVVTQPGRLEFLSKILQRGSARGKRNTVAFLESLADSEELPELRAAIAATDGIVQGIVHLIGTLVPTKKSSGGAAKIATKCLFSLCLCREGKERAVAAGAAGILVQRLVSLEKGDAERALGTVELLCTTEAGCNAVTEHHGLAVPALLGFVLKVSVRATEHATGALLAVCSHSEGARRNALRAGVVKELLLLMQSDSCSDRAKAKALGLLKLFDRSLWFENPSTWMPDCGRTDVVAF